MFPLRVKQDLGLVHRFRNIYVFLAFTCTWDRRYYVTPPALNESSVVCVCDVLALSVLLSPQAQSLPSAINAFIILAWFGWMTWSLIFLLSLSTPTISPTCSLAALLHTLHPILSFCFRPKYLIDINFMSLNCITAAWPGAALAHLAL